MGRLARMGSKASCANCAARREALDTQEDDVPMGISVSSGVLGFKKGSNGDFPGINMGAGPSPSAHAQPTGGGV